MYGYVGLCKAIERNVFHILANGEPLYDAYTTYLPFCESSAGLLLVLWFPQATTLSISNSLPTNEDICSSVIFTWGVCYSACTKVLCFTITNKHGRSTEAIACEKQTYFRSSLSLSLGRPEMRLLFEGLSKRM